MSNQDLERDNAQIGVEKSSNTSENSLKNPTEEKPLETATQTDLNSTISHITQILTKQQDQLGRLTEYLTQSQNTPIQIMNNPQPQVHPEYSRIKRMFEEIKHCDDNDLPCPYSAIHNSEFAGQNLLNAYCNYYAGSSFEELFGDGKADNPRYSTVKGGISK